MTSARKKQVLVVCVVIVAALALWLIVNGVSAQATANEEGVKVETVEYLVTGDENAIDTWNSFSETVNAGEPARIKVYQEFEEGTINKEIWYDGKSFYVQHAGSDEVKEYEYFYIVEGHLPDAACYDYYGILANEEYTYSDITGFYLSNLCEAREIEFEEVFLIKTPVE